MEEEITVSWWSFLLIAVVAGGIAAWYYWRGLDVAGSIATLTAIIGWVMSYILFYFQVARPSDIIETPL